MALDENYLDAYILRANTKFKLDDPDGALLDFTKVIELQPDNRDAYLHSAQLKWKLMDYTGAENDFLKAIEINPDDTEILFMLTELKFELKDYDYADLYLTSIIDKDERNDKAYLQRGIARFNQQKYHERFSRSF